MIQLFKNWFKNIRGLRFVECESFLESNSSDILALCETNLDDSIDSGNFSVTVYLRIIRKNSINHMHGFAVYMKEGFPFARDVSLENSTDYYLCFRLALLHSIFYLFFLYRTPSSTLCTDFDSISSNIDDVLSMNQSANMFAFGDFNVHLVEILNLLNFAIIFVSRMTLLRWLTFLLGFLTVTLMVLLFWIFF